MIAFAWKVLVWFGIGVAVALSVLIVPLHVAAERKKLDTTTTEIAQAERDIRALQTEFETRANIAQLERWNGDTLRLAAPVAAQYIRDEATLAALDFHHPLGGNLDVRGDVRMAAAIVPSQPVGPSEPESGAPVAMAAVATPLRPASTATRTIAEVKTAAVTRAHAQAVAMLDRKLLSDSMLGDLVSGASAEAGRLR